MLVRDIHKPLHEHTFTIYVNALPFHDILLETAALICSSL